MKLLSQYPSLAAQIDQERNGSVDVRRLTAKSAKEIWWRCPAGPDHLWSARVYSRVDGNGCPFCAGKRASVTNSLLAARPELAAEWHSERNGALQPTDVTCGSDRKVWWCCPAGPDHEWQAVVSSRTRGAGCPFCSGRRASTTNSLAAVAPAIAKQWHRSKNGALLPNQVPAGSSRVAWWKCRRGVDHEWACKVDDRVRSNTGCPFCAGRRVSAGTSLAGIAPLVAKEWHASRNGELTPRDVTAKSERVVWWRCKKNPKHTWQSSIGNRIRLKRACPFCAGQQVTRDRSLGALNRGVARQWDEERNGDRTPYDVAPSARLVAWWKCPRGADHRWSAPVYARTQPGASGCPFCTRHRVSAETCLATRFPAVAREWHPTANLDLTPKSVAGRSSKRVWWRCQFRHEWLARVSDRTRPNGTGCPVCARGHRSPMATTCKRKRGMRVPEYEGVRRGPVRKVR